MSKASDYAGWVTFEVETSKTTVVIAEITLEGLLKLGEHSLAQVDALRLAAWLNEWFSEKG